MKWRKDLDGDHVAMGRRGEYRVWKGRTSWWWSGPGTGSCSARLKRLAVAFAEAHDLKPAVTETRVNLVKVDLRDETSWAEHVEGAVYRSLNNTLSNVTLRLPEGHERVSSNGIPCNLRWGHL